MQYTEAQREAALGVSLCLLAEQLGFTVTRMGRTRGLKEISSIRIYNDKTWHRFSGKSRGGTQIDFMMEFGDCNSVPEAIAKILDMARISVSDSRIKKNPADICPAGKQQPEKESANVPFQLPPPAGNYKRAFAYLHEQRGISYQTFQFMVNQKILYEETVHRNLVFVGRNPEGEAKYAALRGTYTYGEQFRGEVFGSDKRYSVHLVNPDCNKLFVFEAVIDMMSYMDLKQDWKSNMLSLGGSSDRALQQFLEDFLHVGKIIFCLDNDESGRKAVFGTEAKVDSDTGEILKEREVGLLEKYSEKGYEAEVEFPTQGKDWNEELLSCRALRVTQWRKEKLLK